MKIIVSIKRVVDHNVQVRPKNDLSGVELAGARMSMNPFDENALEEAVRLKEQGIACARRTVAKYREQLKIAPASLRKQI